MRWRYQKLLRPVSAGITWSLVAGIAWLGYGAREWYIRTFTAGYNIRVDMLMIVPGIYFVTLVGVILVARAEWALFRDREGSD